jgi:hypothetical protein
LTPQEVLAFEMVTRAGGMSSIEVSKQTGLPAEGADLVMDRLLQLHYVTRKGARYEADVRPRGL